MFGEESIRRESGGMKKEKLEDDFRCSNLTTLSFIYCQKTLFINTLLRDEHVGSLINLIDLTV